MTPRPDAEGGAETGDLCVGGRPLCLKFPRDFGSNSAARLIFLPCSRATFFFSKAPFENERDPTFKRKSSPEPELKVASGPLFQRPVLPPSPSAPRFQ